MEKITLRMFFALLSSKIKSCLLPRNKNASLGLQTANLFLSPQSQNATLRKGDRHYRVWKTVSDCFFGALKYSLVVFIFSSNLFSQIAPVNIPLTGFNIDGKVKADSAIGDWTAGTGAGGYVLQQTAGVWGPVDSESTKFIQDDFNNNSDKIFTGSAFSDDPNNWKWTTGKATNKCDINNVIVHTATSDARKWIILGGDRLTTTGTSYIDFEFSQGIFSRHNSNGTFSSVAADGGSLALSNGRTPGDFVLSMEYSNGGTNATVHYYKWEKPAGSSTFKYVEKPIPLAATGTSLSAFGATNGGPISVPFGAFGSTTYISYAFVEAAINIDAILTAECRSTTIKTVFVKTKASDSYNAALKDFVDPIPVQFTFGTAGLSYPSTNFCKTGVTRPSIPEVPNGTFSYVPIAPTLANSILSINTTTGAINLESSDAGSYTVSYAPSSGDCINPATATVNVKAIPSLTIVNPDAVCSPSTVNLTASAVTNGSTLEGGSLSYWTTEAATTSLASPSAVATSGIYYIKVTTGAGCTDIKSVAVTVNSKPSLTIVNPDAVCSPSTVNLTASAVTNGSTLEGGSLSYWTTEAATTSLASPSAVATSGIYYIKVTTGAGCTDIKSVAVTVNSKPSLTIVNPDAVCSPSTVNLTASAVTNGSTLEGGSLSYWTTEAATTSLASPSAVATSGIYYIKVTTGAGCTDIKSVAVTVNSKPSLTIVNPDAVCSPSTVNLTASAVTNGSTLEGGSLSYWTTEAATTSLASPSAVATSGIYYIKVTTGAGCIDIKSVAVTVNGKPDAPTFCVVQPSLCSTAKGSVTINSPCGAEYEYSIKNGDAGTWQSAILFGNLDPGDVTGIRVRNKNTGCVSNAAFCATSNCSVAPCQSSAKIARPEAKTISVIAPIETSTSTTSKTASSGFDAYPVPFKDQLTVKYKFDYKSDVKIEVFNAQGISVLSKSDTNGYMNKEVTLDLKLNKEKEQVYIVKLTTDRETSTKKVLSSK